MDGWRRRILRGPGSWQRTVVVVAAVALAVGALGFLLWGLVTRNSAQLAWLTSMATIWAVVLPAWGMSVAMLAWVLKSAKPPAEPVPEPAAPPARAPGASPEPAPRPSPEPEAFGAGTPVRLTTMGVRSQYLDAFALRKDGTVSHWWWPEEDRQHWSKSESFRALPGEYGQMADIAAVSRGPGHAEVFAVDRRGNLWHRWWLEGEGWADWQHFIGDVAGPIAACSLADGHIQVFVTDPQVGVIKYSSSSVAARWDPWRSLP